MKIDPKIIEQIKQDKLDQDVENLRAEGTTRTGALRDSYKKEGDTVVGLEYWEDNDRRKPYVARALTITK